MREKSNQYTVKRSAKNEVKHNEGRHQLALPKLVDGLAEKMVRR